MTIPLHSHARAGIVPSPGGDNDLATFRSASVFRVVRPCAQFVPADGPTKVDPIMALRCE